MSIVFISSGAVDDIHSVADLSHPDVTGYLASKYVNETLLKQAGEKQGTPVTIIRMLNGEITTKNDDVAQSPIDISEVTESICQMGLQLSKRNQYKDLSAGTSISFTRVTDLSSLVCKEIQRLCVQSAENRKIDSELDYHHYSESACLHGEGRASLFDVGNKNSVLCRQWQELPMIPANLWFGKAKMNGFEYSIASQVVKVGDMVSRR